MLPFFLQGLTLGFAAGAQPGPFQTYLISQTLSQGWRRAWIAAFGPLLSDGPIVALVLLVLSQIPGLGGVQSLAGFCAGCSCPISKWTPQPAARRTDERAQPRALPLLEPGDRAIDRLGLEAKLVQRGIDPAGFLHSDDRA
jgi:hypothetical protein